MTLGGRNARRVILSAAISEWTRWIGAHPPQFSPARWVAPKLADTLLRQAVVELIASGGDAVVLAQDVMRRGGDRCVDRRIQDALGLWTEVLRTEFSRAMSLSLIANSAQNPEVAGIRYLLSPRHPRLDVCDLLASANLFGLGPGVYPLHRVPYPAHPGTLSYLEVVFEDECVRSSPESPIRWLEQQTEEVQRGVLGSSEKFERLHAGLLTEAEAIPPPRAY